MHTLKCQNCPGIVSLRNKFIELIDGRDVIRYNKWISKDRSMLEQMELRSDSFIEDITAKTSALTIHHYFEKSQ